jgi:hypothetical protein
MRPLAPRRRAGGAAGRLALAALLAAATLLAPPACAQRPSNTTSNATASSACPAMQPLSTGYEGVLPGAFVGRRPPQAFFTTPGTPVNASDPGSPLANYFLLLRVRADVD